MLLILGSEQCYLNLLLLVTVCIPVLFSLAIFVPQKGIMMSDTCELLSVKLALEECRHWLEAKQPFLVWITKAFHIFSQLRDKIPAMLDGLFSSLGLVSP